MQRQFITFLVVGALCYGAYVAAFKALRVATPDVVALTIAYVVAVLLHFFLNKAFTFRTAPPLHGRMVTRYLAVAAINYVVSTTIGLSLLRCGVVPFLALGIAIAATTALGFVLIRQWVFAD